MSDEVLVEGPKVTFGFKRSVRVREYENAEASIYIEVPTAPGDDLDTIVANAKLTAFAAKSVIFEQLGIEFTITPEQVVQELLEQKLGAVEIAERSDPAAEAKAAAAASDTKPARKGPAANAPKSKDELWRELQDSPSRYFDNRSGKKNPKSPDFKRKGAGEGLWLKNQKGESQVPEGIVVPDSSAF